MEEGGGGQRKKKREVMRGRRIVLRINGDGERGIELEQSYTLTEKLSSRGLVGPLFLE